jgi:GNAT superfamily N-acetyltransferase
MKMKMRRIRPAVLSDAREIARLNGELGYSACSSSAQTNLQSIISSENHAIIVCEECADQVLGWIVVEKRVSLETGETAEISGLVVDPGARRKGIGTALVLAAEQWAQENELYKIVVRSNAARVESHPFYEKLVYVRRKTQHCYSKQRVSI